MSNRVVLAFVRAAAVAVAVANVDATWTQRARRARHARRARRAIRDARRMACKTRDTRVTRATRDANHKKRHDTTRAGRAEPPRRNTHDLHVEVDVEDLGPVDRLGGKLHLQLRVALDLARLLRLLPGSANTYV